MGNFANTNQTALLLLLRMLLAFVCVTKIYCFNAAIVTLPNVKVAPSFSTLSTLRQTLTGSNISCCSSQLRAHVGGHFTCRSINYCSSKGSFKSFPQTHRSKQPISRLKMTSTSNDSNADVSKNKTLLVRMWLKLRTFLARLWILILKPFEMLKSIIKKKSDGDRQVIKTEEADESIQEEDAITQLDNLAVDEGENDAVAATATATDDVATLVIDEKEAFPVVEDVSTEDKTSIATAPTQRQATATVDFTGNWTLIVDDAFKSQYDSYLRKLGQPLIVRTLALTVIGSTKEEAIQSEGGKQLYIRGMNVRGSWERTLEASETDIGDVIQEGMHAVEGHVLKPMVTADDEEVEVASWWEDGGRVHRSWVVGGKKYGGGDFENKRYLSDNGNILVCESTFHPKEGGRDDVTVTWRFLREGAIYGDAGFALPNIFDILKKETEERSDEDKPESGMVVGDIMDSVTSSEEADGLLSKKDVISNSIEEAIERGNWIPPMGDRWAISSPDVNLSGKWKLIITEQFKEAYDEFLKALGQPIIVRGAALILVGNTREETKQSDGGRSVYIKGVNAKGIWERTLISSGSDFDTTLFPNKDGSYFHVPVKILTADSEKVDATSWWENDGTVHVSWTKGVKRYGGGSFESRRYLENNGDVYICESIFHRDNASDGPDPCLKWKFLREGATIFIGSSKY